MEKPNSYCEYVKDLEQDNLHRIYHDTEYGFEVETDDELFGRLILEINQAGLSWSTILKKKDNFRTAYANFNVEKIASYKEQDINRLMNNAGIIRNKLKIKAAIYNANQIVAIKEKHGSFKSWLDKYKGLKLEQWVKLFKENFKFTGGEITNEFLMSTGYINGAHQQSCPIYNKIKK